MEHKIEIDNDFPIKEIHYNDYDDDNYSSDEYEDEYDMFINDVNDFLDDNFYNVILLCEQIRNFYNPDFLSKLNSDRLMNILVDYIFYNGVFVSICEKELSKFIDNYTNDIGISHNIINRFLLPYKCQMDYDLWTRICKKYSS